MLVRFSVQNFKTFREKATLDLIASNSDKDTREEENVIFDEKLNLRILKSAVMYGANASGKSKFIEAFMFMKQFVISSSKETQTGEKIDVDPFRLNEASENEPSEFEISFEIEGILYRYGFEANPESVIAEWLFYKPKTKEVELFYRENQQFEIHPRKLSKARAITKEGLVRKNALLLSVAAQFNEPIAILILEWFKKFKTLSGLHEDGYQGFTMNEINNPLQKKKIIELLKGADLGIHDLVLEPLDLDALSTSIPKVLREKLAREAKEDNAEFYSDTKVTHRKYNSARNSSTAVQFSMDEDESSGTKKFFALSGPILYVLENGFTLVVDELDSKLHPNLVCKIVELFNSKETNPHNAQLIFNTHDTNLLSSGLFRRDQIWFFEKNEFGEARLYSLGDFKSDEVRKNEAFEDNYIRGKYGAIPYLGMFDDLEANFLTERPA